MKEMRSKFSRKLNDTPTMSQLAHMQSDINNHLDRLGNNGISSYQDSTPNISYREYVPNTANIEAYINDQKES
jgi:hypothetical protein